MAKKAPDWGLKLCLGTAWVGDSGRGNVTKSPALCVYRQSRKKAEIVPDKLESPSAISNPPKGRISLCVARVCNCQYQQCECQSGAIITKITGIDQIESMIYCRSAKSQSQSSIEREREINIYTDLQDSRRLRLYVE